MRSGPVSLLVPAAVVVAAAGLASCAPEPAVEAPQPQQVVVAAEQLDTGEYRVEPFNVGALFRDHPATVETLGYGDHLLAAYEVDPQFERSLGGGPLFNLAAMPLVGDEDVKPLHDHKEDFIGGFHLRGKEGDRITLHAVLKFSSPEVAEAIVQDWQRSMLEECTLIAGTFEMGSAPLAIPGHPEVAAAQIGPDVRAVAAHGEFVVYASTHMRPAMGAYGYEAIPDSELAWEPGYLSAYFDKQVPEVAAMQPRLDPDPKGILRYSVPPLKITDYTIPFGVSNKQYASFFTHPERALELLNQAGVDAVALNEVQVLRARDETAARRLQEGLSNLVEGEDWRGYPEPQGLPDTVCQTKDEEREKTYECTTRFGRYVATAGVSDIYTEVEDDGAQMELSRKMAAQYRLFQQMP